MNGTDLLQYKALFVSESKEHLVSLRAAFIDLEKSPWSKGTLEDIYRICGALKGMAAAMGYYRINDLAANIEAVSGKMRAAGAGREGSLADVGFECLDKFQQLIEEAETGGTQNTDIDALVIKLNKLVDTHEKEGNILSSIEGGIETTRKTHLGTGKAATEGTAEPENTRTHFAGQGERVVPGGTLDVEPEDTDKLLSLSSSILNSGAMIEKSAGDHPENLQNNALRQLEKAAMELQNTVLGMRTSAVERLFPGFRKTVEEEAAKCAKQAELVISAQNIAIDRMLIGSIEGIITQVLKNAVIHGLETPGERKEKGKPEKGRLQIRIRLTKNSIFFSVRDDGAGLNVESIRRTAVAKGIMSEQQAAAAEPEAVYRLICHKEYKAYPVQIPAQGPHGMTAVKEIIDSASGTFRISSASGAGSAFHFKIPLKISVLTALTVKMEENIYAIPLENVSDIVYASEGVTAGGKAGKSTQINGETLPLVRFDGGRIDAEGISRQYTKKYILKIKAENGTFAVAVDNLLGKKRVVLKPMPDIYDASENYLGAGMLEDGALVLVIDANSVAAKNIMHGSGNT